MKELITIFLLISAVCMSFIATKYNSVGCGFIAFILWLSIYWRLI